MPCCAQRDQTPSSPIGAPITLAASAWSATLLAPAAGTRLVTLSLPRRLCGSEPSDAKFIAPPSRRLRSSLSRRCCSAAVSNCFCFWANMVIIWTSDSPWAPMSSPPSRLDTTPPVFDGWQVLTGPGLGSDERSGRAKTLHARARDLRDEETTSPWHKAQSAGDVTRFLLRFRCCSSPDTSRTCAKAAHPACPIRLPVKSADVILSLSALGSSTPE